LDNEEEPDGLIVDDFIATVKCSIDSSYLISQQLQLVNSYDHATIILYHTHLATVTVEVMQSGQSLLIRDALCPSFHNVNAFNKLIMVDSLLKQDKDNDVRFWNVREVSHLMTGESTLMCIEKTVSIPFAINRFLVSSMLSEHPMVS